MKGLYSKAVRSAAIWRRVRRELVYSREGTILKRGWCSLNAQNASAWFINRGEISLRKDGEEFSARKGQWLFINEGDYERSFSEDANILSVRFRLRWPNRQPLFKNVPIVVDHTPQFNALRKTGKLLAAYLEDMRIDRPTQWRQPDYKVLIADTSIQQFFRIDHLFAEWIELYIAAMLELGADLDLIDTWDERLSRAVFILENHALDQTFSEATFARELGLSQSHMKRLFRQHLQCSPFQIVQQRRIEAVRHALEWSDDPIKVISIEFGFTSLSRFSSWCRRYLGAPPRILRQRPQNAHKNAEASHSK